VSRPERLEDDVVDSWLAGHPAWILENDHLVRELRTVDYPSGVAIVAAQVDLAQRLDHHPIATVGYREVRLVLFTHDRGGITRLDLEYAGAFDQLLDERFSSVLSVS